MKEKNVGKIKVFPNFVSWAYLLQLTRIDIITYVYAFKRFKSTYHLYLFCYL